MTQKILSLDGICRKRINEMSDSKSEGKSGLVGGEGGGKYWIKKSLNMILDRLNPGSLKPATGALRSQPNNTHTLKREQPRTTVKTQSCGTRICRLSPLSP
jgi:hypothetical protein